MSEDCGFIRPVVLCRSADVDPRLVDESLASLREAGPALPPIVLRAGDALPDDSQDLGHRAPSWLCVIEAGDRIAKDAFLYYSAAAEDADGATLIYADDDLIGEEGERRSPHFKPNWNALLSEHHDYLTGACICHRDVVDIESLASLDLAKFAQQRSVAATPPRHLPLVLHHRRRRPAPRVPEIGSPQVLSPAPSMTVIIPTRNQVDLLQACVSGLDVTSYPGMKLIIIDNGSDEPATLRYLEALQARGDTVLHMPGPFNYSRLNNEAVKQVDTDLLCFLNNDVEMMDAEWLSTLAARAIGPDVGAVGAQLLYPDRSVQHAGVVIGIGGGAGHAHRFVNDNETGYFCRHMLPQSVSAVTGACMVVGRQKFLDVGGFDEELFPVAFNDVDLCLKLDAVGWQCVYEPRARLIHHESKSRGKDSARRNKARFASELEALKRKWRTDERRDPYHHPHLSPFTEQFLIAV